MRQPRATLGGEIAGELDLFAQRQHVRIKPRVEQHLGLDFPGLAMRLGLGEQAVEAAEDLQEGRNGGVVEGHVMLSSSCGMTLRAETALLEMGRLRVNCNLCKA